MKRSPPGTVRSARGSQAARRWWLLLVPVLAFGVSAAGMDLLEHAHGDHGRHVHTVPAGVAGSPDGHADEWHLVEHGSHDHGPAPEDERPEPIAPGVLLRSSSADSWRLASHAKTLRLAPTLPAAPILRVALEGWPPKGPPPDPLETGQPRSHIGRLLLSSHALLI